MALAFVGLGSNLGDRRKNLLAAWEKLGEVPGVVPGPLSSPYETAPVNLKTSHWFINAVGQLTTDLPPHKLLGELLAIELELGRDRKKTGDRPADLDLLYYDDLMLNEPGLVVPHPEIQNRLFVLVPLAELAPDFLHPALRRTTSELGRRLAGSELAVRKTSWRSSGGRLAAT